MCGINCWIFWYQKRMHSFENKIGWQMVYENGPWYLYQYCGLKNLYEFVLKFFWLSTRKFINENIYCHGTGKISSFLKDFYKGYAPTIILMSFFCKVNILLLLEEFPPKIIPYSIIDWKYGKQTGLQCDIVADMEHRSNCLVCCT
jgi:hypothetical protein